MSVTGTAPEEGQSVFGRFAAKVDGYLARKYYGVGFWVGSRPGLSCALSIFFLLLCCGGFSQLKSESRADKLWIPQGTRAQDDESVYTAVFPPTTRLSSVMLEAKSGSALDKGFLEAALELHWEIERLSFEGDSLRSLCVSMPGDGHPCFVNSILGDWDFNNATLAADPDPLATLNAAGRSAEDFQRLLGGAAFSAGGALSSAKVVSITYFMESNRELDGGGYMDPKGEGWEEKFLEFLKCDAPTCSGDTCACGYESEHFSVYAQASRSPGDAFGEVIRGDVGLINGAFLIMILYLILNLGGLCHKVNSRALLAFACTLSIVAAGLAGYGLSMWFQFMYTPVHSVLPFVIIGIGVDDSFVIMNALDRTDPTKPVPERIASAISHAGVSVMVTSLTDFVAFAISVSSALPALSAFCMYAALSVLMLFVYQITMFTALATLDARRVAANRIDCCFCLPKGFPCCPTVSQEESARSIKDGSKDPNQMCCCSPPSHKGGRVGRALEHGLAPLLVKPAVSVAVVLLFTALCGLCAWQATKLAVQDTQRSFIPDGSYVLTTIEKNDEYFGNLGTRFDIMTVEGDYFATQRGLTTVGGRIGALEYVVPTDGNSFSSWADSFKAACADGAVGGVTLDADGFASAESEYYAGLKAWLSGAGGRFAKDVVWVDEADPQKGIKATKMAAELKSVNKEVAGRFLPDAAYAVEAMDAVRNVCDGMTDLPGGKAVPYTFNFLTWETFKIIQGEMYASVGLCLAAVFVITGVLIAHPLTSSLVFVCVLMTIVDILGCMNMWGLAIDSVSVIQLVISVGLSVDYAAHVGHNFMTQVGTRAERVIGTLGDVGAAVLCGGISTFLGVLLLALSKSYVFRVLFQTFFLTVVLGVAHGLLLLPALLSLVGPPSYRAGTKGEVENVEVDIGAKKDSKDGR